MLSTLAGVQNQADTLYQEVRNSPALVTTAYLYNSGNLVLLSAQMNNFRAHVAAFTVRVQAAVTAIANGNAPQLAGLNTIPLVVSAAPVTRVVGNLLNVTNFASVFLHDYK